MNLSGFRMDFSESENPSKSIFLDTFKKIDLNRFKKSI